MEKEKFHVMFKGSFSSDNNTSLIVDSVRTHLDDEIIVFKKMSNDLCHDGTLNKAYKSLILDGAPSMYYYATEKVYVLKVKKVQRVKKEDIIEGFGTEESLLYVYLEPFDEVSKEDADLEIAIDMAKDMMSSKFKLYFKAIVLNEFENHFYDVADFAEKKLLLHVGERLYDEESGFITPTGIGAALADWYAAWKDTNTQIGQYFEENLLLKDIYVNKDRQLNSEVVRETLYEYFREWYSRMEWS